MRLTAFLINLLSARKWSGKEDKTVPINRSDNRYQDEADIVGTCKLSFSFISYYVFYSKMLFTKIIFHKIWKCFVFTQVIFYHIRPEKAISVSFIFGIVRVAVCESFHPLDG